MNTLIVGDIHGCDEDLMALLDAAGSAASDQITSLGEIADRGPNTPAVLRKFGRLLACG